MPRKIGIKAEAQIHFLLSFKTIIPNPLLPLFCLILKNKIKKTKKNTTKRKGKTEEELDDHQVNDPNNLLQHFFFFFFEYKQ